MTLSEMIIRKEKAPRLTSKETHWDLFCELIEEKINLQVPIKNAIQLEDELELLNETIQCAAVESTPSTMQKHTNQNKTYPIEVKELVQKKRKARKTWQINRSPENKTILNNLCNKLKSLIKEVKNKSINSYLTSLTGEKDTEYSLWRATKSLKRPKIHIPPIKKDDGTWAQSDKQNVDLFAEYLQEIFQRINK